MRILVFGMLLLLLSCHPVDVGLGSNAYSNLKYTLNNGTSELVYNNLSVSQIKFSFQTADTLTEDISIGLTFESESLTSDQVFSDFNQKILAAKGSKSFSWSLTLNSNLSSSQNLNFKIKIKDFNDKIQFTPDSFSFDFNINFPAPVISSPAANSYINNQNQASFSVGGTCITGDTVTVKLKSNTDINQSTDCFNSSFAVSLNLTLVDDGPITLVATQKNILGNTSPATEISYIKDTIVKNITITSDANALKNSTSSVASFSLTGTALLSAAGENEADYNIYLYSDNSCSDKIATSAIISDHFTFPVSFNAQQEGPKKFYARLKEASGSLSVCTDLAFNYYYTTKSIYIGGNFNTFDSVSAKNIAKLNPDGSRISSISFTTGTGYVDGGSDDYVRSIIPVSGSNFLVVGLFSTYNNTSAINANYISSGGIMNAGVLLPLFNNSIKTALQDDDNSTYFGGNFDFIYNAGNGYLPRRAILKLDSNHNIDDTFTNNANATGAFPANSSVWTIAKDASGIYAGGSIAGQIIKLSHLGIEDTTFKGNMGTGFDGIVYSIKILPSGDLAVGGDFTTYNGINCPKIAKLSASGVLDSTFCAKSSSINLDGYVLTLEIDSRGKIWLGGSFTKKLTVLDQSGNHYAPTFLSAGFDATVYVIKEYVDGKMLIGGDFTTYNGLSSPGLIKINKDGAVDQTFQGNGKLSGGESVYTISF